MHAMADSPSDQRSSDHRDDVASEQYADATPDAVLEAEQLELGQYIAAHAVSVLLQRGLPADKEVSFENGAVPLRWYINRGLLWEVLREAGHSSIVVVNNDQIETNVGRIVDGGDDALDDDEDHADARALFNRQLTEMGQPALLRLEPEFHLHDENSDTKVIDSALVIRLVGSAVQDALEHALQDTKLIDNGDDLITFIRLIRAGHEVDFDTETAELVQDCERRVTFLLGQASSNVAMLSKRVEHHLGRKNELRLDLAEVRNNVRSFVSSM